MSLRHDLLYPAACIAGLSAGSVQPAHAGDLRMTVERPHFTCEGSGMMLSHVAYRAGRPGVVGPVLPCCDGKLGCAQFLSTTTVLHALRQWHG